MAIKTYYASANEILFPREGGPSSPTGLKAQNLFDQMTQCAEKLGKVKEVVGQISLNGIETFTLLDVTVSNFNKAQFSAEQIQTTLLGKDYEPVCPSMEANCGPLEIL